MVKKLIFVIILFGLQQTAFCSENLSQGCSLEASSEHVIQPSYKNGLDLMIFVSLGMPKNSLLQWSEQANKVGASLVVRGFKGNSLTETVACARKIWGDKAKNLVIDPTAFERFQINSVPAVLIAEKGNDLEENDTSIFPKHDVIYGDVGLLYALKKIKEKGDLGPYLEYYLERLTQ